MAEGQRQTALCLDAVVEKKDAARSVKSAARRWSWVEVV
jgi:hypothetical protein